MLNQFKETYNNIVNAIGYTKPLSYNEWVELPDDFKAGALFVQFYEQIYLAWLKTRTDAAIEEECVSEVLAYLTKNVYGDFVNRLHNQNKKLAVKAFSKFELKKLQDGRLVSTKQFKYRRKFVSPLTYKDWESSTTKFSIVHFVDGDIVTDEVVPMIAGIDGEFNYPKMFELSDFDLIDLLPVSERTYYKFNPETTKITERNFKPSYFYKVAYNCIYCKSIDYVKIPTTWYNNTCSNISVMPDGNKVDVFDSLIDTAEHFDDEIMSNKFWNIIESQDESTKDVISKLLSDDDISDILNSSIDIINELRNKLIEFKDYYLGA